VHEYNETTDFLTHIGVCHGRVIFRKLGRMKEDALRGCSLEDALRACIYALHRIRSLLVSIYTVLYLFYIVTQDAL